MHFPKHLLKADIDPSWLLRIFTVIPIVLILLAGGAAIWMYFFVLSLLPQSQSRVDTPGISANVQVVRDGNGIPGIIGSNEEDVAQVFGYVMAQDRLWQMDYLRRAGRGRLAEILGSDYLERDRLMRSLAAGFGNLYKSEQLGDRERKWVEGFVEGINRYMATHARKLPVEFSLLEYHPRPFQPEDVMWIVLGLAWESSAAARVDPVMNQILGRLGANKALELFPSDPAVAAPLIVSDLVGWVPTGDLFSLAKLGRDRVRFPGWRGGCAWAVGPRNTRSGKPMTACSTYQVLTAPGLWYRARLVAGDFRLSGAFIPGVPVAIAGTNGKVSWGGISTPVDDADLYIERLDSDKADSFWRVDRLHKMHLSNEALRVRGRSSVTHTIRLTDHGPIVSDVHDSRALSLRWTAFHGLGLVKSFYALNRAATGRDLRSSLTRLKAPCLDVAWADEKGHWGVQTAGLVPVRPRGSDGIAAMPGWTGVHDWVGFIPFDDLPSVTDPTSGMAVVSDGRPGGKAYPFFVSCYWSADSRAERVRELLRKTPEQYRESFQGILNDTFSPQAKRLVPVLVKAVETKTKQSKEEAEALRLLLSWDFDMNRDSAAAAVFALTYRALVRELFLSSLGRDLYDGFTAYGPLPARTVEKIVLEKRISWLGDRNLQAVLKRSFKNAVESGSGLMGADPKKWQWGAIHRAEFVHPLTRRSRFLEALYHVGPLSFRGSDDTIDCSGWSLSHPFRAIEGVSLKQVAEMTEPPQVSGISPLGSSAHFFSTHYKDQVRAWLAGRSLRDPLAVADIQKTGASTVLFQPVHKPAVTMSRQR